ncbi:MAG: iron-containing redox enzyme family protein [Polyangiales bacterium]
MADLIPEFGELPRRAQVCGARELYLSLFTELEERVEYTEAGFHFVRVSLAQAPSISVGDDVIGSLLASPRAPALPLSHFQAVREYAPQGLADGAWLRGFMLANVIENEVGMRVLSQLMTRFGGPGVQEGYAPRYSALLRSLGINAGAVLRAGGRVCSEQAYEHALLGVALGLFPSTYGAETLGYNLWMCARGPCPALERALPELEREGAHLHYLTLHDRERMLQLAKQAVELLPREQYARVARGFAAAEASYARWQAHAAGAAFSELQDAYLPPQEREALEQFAFTRYGTLGNTELYHCFVNIDLHPAARLVAKEYAGTVFARIADIFASDERLHSREPPRYSEREIAEIVARQHQKNVASRDVPNNSLASSDSDEAVKGIQEVFDGCWVQGFADVQRADFEEYGWLFRIYASEHGDGDFAWNHCQIFRRAFAEQLGDDVMLPKSDPRLYDLFEIGFAAMVTMSVSLNTRHFMPEILGINLGIESTGVGGSYMEQWKGAEQEGNHWRALAWRLHNSIDNYADGHTKWSLSAVQSFMKRVKDGSPAAVDEQWGRLWRLWRCRDILVHGTLDEQAALDEYFAPPDAQPSAE